MLKKFLKEVVVIVVGKQAEEIAELLDSKKHVNEFLIAKKLDITINQTRNILYKISDQGLVSSIRKKDKRKGWYTYFWKIETLKSLEFLKRNLLKKINQLEHQIKTREINVFYLCENCNIEFNEENSLLHNFICPECGRVFSRKDNAKLLRELKRNLDKLKKELILVEEEIKKEEEKTEKKKLREVKKRAKPKKKKPVKKKKIKKRAVKKKAGKKKPTKKSTKKKIIKKKAKKKSAKKMKKKIIKISKKKSVKKRMGRKNINKKVKKLVKKAGKKKKFVKRGKKKK